MAWQIEKIDVDGRTFVGCRHSLATDATEAEVGSEGVAEATITAAATGTTITVTSVASPTTTPNPGPSRSGIVYTPQGKMARCAVCGYVYHRKELVKATGRRAGAGSLVCKECLDEVVPQIRTGAARRTGGL